MSTSFYDFLLLLVTQLVHLCVAQAKRLSDSTSRLTTPRPSPPLLLLSRRGLKEEGVCSEPCPLCLLHATATKYTLAHHTHEDRPRLHSPQAPFAVKGLE